MSSSMKRINIRKAEGPDKVSGRFAPCIVTMLFVDFSSAFNTVIPDKLILKLHNLGLPSSLCHWIRDFLTNRPQVVRIGDNTSSTLVLSTGTPQGCVLSPALFTLFTSDCSAIPLHKHHRKVCRRHHHSGPHIGQ
ncbi:hypothetical protein L3Q82_005343 [Scortum barcoo]|uniref:Uncharacterized protein n=1 Tax=Scortum barcoo TaxID=214431 RepID=A0ACB8V9M4_9TELE|nr:hypothetical protein L3Q82_005343 [Scortum barcoo]